jgi:hypothetical protein
MTHIFGWKLSQNPVVEMPADLTRQIAPVAILDFTIIEILREAVVKKIIYYHIIYSKKRVEIRSKRDHSRQDSGAMAVLTDCVASVGKYNGGEMEGSQKLVVFCEW